MRRRDHRRLAAGLLAALVLLGGCSPGRDSAGGPSPGEPVSVASRGSAGGAVDIARRSAGVPGVPAVVGDAVDSARAALSAAGLDAQVVAFAADAAVAAQYPRPGEPPPADGVVTVWLGDPPPLPDPPPPASESPGAPEPAPAPGPVELATSAEVAPEPLPPLVEGGAEDPSGAGAEQTPVAGPRRGQAAASAPAGTVMHGPATWYGPGFAGNPTACGGRFDPDELTMASRELPCGTRVRVTGPAGRSVDVTVTDWGPAEWTGKRFDLSAAAFARIASLRAGVIPVTVEVLDR